MKKIFGFTIVCLMATMIFGSCGCQTSSSESTVDTTVVDTLASDSVTVDSAVCAD